MAGKPVRLVLDTGASVSAIKEEVLKEIYGLAPLSAVQTLFGTYLSVNFSHLTTSDLFELIQVLSFQ